MLSCTFSEQPLRHADQERTPHQYWRLQFEQLVVLHTRVDLKLACLKYICVDLKLPRIQHVDIAELYQHVTELYQHVTELDHYPSVFNFHSGIFYLIPVVYLSKLQ